MNKSTTPRRGIGFTLTELLVVITLLAIIVAVGLPSFGAMMNGSNRTLAIGQVKAALASARDAAIRSTDSDSAAVFFFEPGGRVTIVPCVQVGTMEDVDPAAPGRYPSVSVRRDVFTRVTVNEPVQLPQGWMIRGYAGAEMLDAPGNDSGWYPALNGRFYDRRVGCWVFPETSFYDLDADSDSASGPGTEALRQTFMVRFEHGTGNLVANRGIPAIVLSPRPSDQATGGGVSRLAGTPAQTEWRRVDRTSNAAMWAKRLLSRRVLPSGSSGNGVVTAADLAGLVGNQSGDTVLAGSVDLIAVYDERSLASSLGARGVNRQSGCLYSWPAAGASPSWYPPTIDSALFSGNQSAQAIGQNIDAWMVGKLVLNGRQVESDAVIYGFDRYTGQPREVKP